MVPTATKRHTRKKRIEKSGSAGIVELTNDRLPDGRLSNPGDRCVADRRAEESVPGGSSLMGGIRDGEWFTCNPCRVSRWIDRRQADSAERLFSSGQTCCRNARE